MTDETINPNDTIEDDTLDDDFEVGLFPYVYEKHGRRTKCTEEVVRQIFVHIARDGATAKDAIAMAGIGEPAYYKWMRRGRKERDRLVSLGVEGDYKDSELVDPNELPYLVLLEAVDKAIPMRKAILVQRIRTAGKDPRNWTANAWLLERLHPEEFGRKTRLDVRQVDWRDEVVELIKQGVEFGLVAEKIGEEHARQLFERAGVEVPGVGAGGESNS